jgi:IS30 family transposase
MRRNGHSIRDIATTLGRGVGTISDELKRNKVAGLYDPKKAQAKATVRRKAAKFQGMTIVANQDLQDFVERELRKLQSPAAIAGRLAAGLDGLPSASRGTIERFIRSVYGRQLEYELKLLKRKRKRSTKRATAEQLQNRTSIADRPSVINNRERVGDVEADFIVSGKSGSGYLLTGVDRKIRYGLVRKLLPVTITNMEQAFLDVKKAFPELKSITTDNDLLFRHHERLEALLGVPIYFCDPYSSWQKGSIENLNKHVRKYIPKSSDISQYNDEYIQFVEARLNGRFMSVLGYRTPQECLTAHRTKPRKEESR